MVARLDERSWTLTVLPLPKRMRLALPAGFGGGGVVGMASGARGYRDHAFLWSDGVPVAIGVGPLGDAWVGRGTAEGIPGAWQTRTKGPRAVAWQAVRGTLTPIELHPHGFANSRAVAWADSRQVGYGEPGGQKGVGRLDRALLWNGSAEGAIELRGPNPDRTTLAHAVSGAVQVGVYGSSWSQHAALWTGSTESMVDLHPRAPAGYPPNVQISMAYGVGDGEQVGTVCWKKVEIGPQAYRAALWHGAADSFADLTPDGFESAEAKACARDFQIGHVSTGVQNTGAHRAALWAGSAESFFNLHGLVPGPWTDSWAVDLRVEGSQLHVLGGVEHAVGEGERRTTLSRQIALWEARLGL